MAGLLDFFSSPDAQLGLGLLAAAAPRAGGVSFGQGMQEALGYVDKQRQMKAAEMAQAQEMAYKKALMEDHQRKAAMEQAAMAQAARKQQAMPQIYRPASQGAPALNMDSMLPAGLQTGLPSIGAVPARAAFIDVQKGLEVGMTADELMKLDNLRNIGRNEVARTMKGMQGGREVDQQVDKYGDPVGRPFEQFKAPIMMDRGGQIDAVSPYTAPGQSFGKTMTFADRNSAGNLAIARERLNFDQSGGMDGYSTKPLPATALKMQNDAIDAIGTAGGINQMLSGVQKQIADKKVKFGPVSNLVNQGLNASGMSTEESRNFSSFKSNLEKIRNESLRLNSGVQTDGDAQRAWNELFQNINDTSLVNQRLGEIKSLNDRAVELQKLKVDGIRGNYKVAPYDYGKLPDSGTPADKPTVSLSSIPQGAISRLKMQPALREAFDAKYGAGASAKILGN